MRIMNKHGLPPLMTLKSGRYYTLDKSAGKLKWISLSRNLDEALQQHAALTGGAFNAKELAPIAPRHDMVRALKETFDAAKGRSKVKGEVYFTLKFDDVLEQATRQNWRCALTGIKFSDDKIDGAHCRPFMTSLDRIKCGEGYTKLNTRLVCVAVNLALSTYGEAVFGVIARGYVSRLPVNRNAFCKKSAKSSNALQAA